MLWKLCFGKGYSLQGHDLVSLPKLWITWHLMAVGSELTQGRLHLINCPLRRPNPTWSLGLVTPLILLTYSSLAVASQFSCPTHIEVWKSSSKVASQLGCWAHGERMKTLYRSGVSFGLTSPLRENYKPSLEVASSLGKQPRERGLQIFYIIALLIMLMDPRIGV